MTNTKRYKSKPTNGSHDFGLSYRRFLNYLFELSFWIASIDQPAEAKSVLEEEFLLGNIGVERLLFQLNAESLHRVYSRGSFKYNGRAYGALHQGMPKHMRPFIHIDGRPTIEPDFSALHIRMLYHREGIDYQQDPYVVPGGPEMRREFKAVGLIAINAINVKGAYGAIRDELADRKIPLPAFDQPLKTMVEMFRSAHKPIEKYLFSDALLKLLHGKDIGKFDEFALGLERYADLLCHHYRAPRAATRSARGRGIVARPSARIRVRKFSSVSSRRIASTTNSNRF